MKHLKVWPHLTMVALVCALVGGGAAALWVKHQQRNELKTLPSAARIERVDGQVGVSHNIAAAPDARQQQDQGQWLQATTNMPVSVGDRIYARDDSRASVAFTGRNFARLDPRTSLDVMYLAPDRTQLALRDGSAIFDVGALAPGQLFEVATPFSAVDFDQPGLYQVGYNDNGSAYVSVLSGLARVVGLGGTGQVSKGEMLTLVGQTAADVVLSRLDPSHAGGLLNDYYGYRYPRLYDGRYSDYNAYLNDPSYYDPYNRFTSYRYVTDYIPGVEDLDYYGDWQDVGGYGECWHPRVDAGWTPYQDGYWTVDDPYGLTWVSNEPWGYAPYHYGRWASVNNQWFWVPETVNTQPVYSPALVAFLPLAQANEVGWVPLGPGDPYVPTYYDPNWQPHYFGGAPVVQQVVNLRVPGAVTVVPVQSFGNVINERDITRVDPQALAQVRPVLDPFAVNYLRQAALQPPKGRRPFDVPPGIARKFEETRVLASTTPSALPFMPNPAQALHVQTVPEGEKRQKLQFRDERGGATAQVTGDGRPAPGRANAPPLDQQRSQQMSALASEAARGNRDARRQLQQLQREQREQQRVEAQQQRAAAQPSQVTPQTVAPRAGNGRAAGMAERQQAQGERVALHQQQQAQRDAERQQALAAREQQRASMRQQTEARRQANAQASAVHAQQAAQREQQMRARAQQQQQVRQQAVRQGPPPQARGRVEQPRPQPQPQRPQPQMRQQGPPQNAERRQGPPPQAARPQPSQGQGQGHGGGKGKGHP